VVAILGIGGCVAPPSSRATSAPPPPPQPVALVAATAPITVLAGRASWYGEPHHGRLTANGERFDMNRLTAAHRTLPFGTRLRVVNLINDRVVEVRINDRGPMIPGRILDLSYAAARALGAVATGVIPIRATIVPTTARAEPR
jgi:rare lipoprotein A